MTKNMEWGAVAYLTQSRYGRCTNGTCDEIYLNNSSSYYTGRSGGSPEASSVTYGSYSYDDYLISDSNEKTTKEVSMGAGASTTGNIYGIYDMSGGEEYVMGNVADGDGFNPRSAGDVWNTVTPLEKYYDIYTIGMSYGFSEDYKRGKLGDATKEILNSVGIVGSWYDGWSLMPEYFTMPWFSRGSNNVNTSIFSYSRSNGSSSDYSSRTVLTTLN